MIRPKGGGLLTAKQKILKDLNEQQVQPVKNIYGPIYVVAAPGSGKTATMTRRVAYMIESGIPAEEILMFTFTKKASEEILSRIIDFVGKKARDVTVGTYHSICYRILRKHADLLGYDKNFTIYDEDNKKNLLKKIIDKDIHPMPLVINVISGFKTKGMTPSEITKKAQNTFEISMAKYYTKYQEELKKCSAMDFDDLLMQCIRLMQKHPHVRELLNKQYKYIMVDEFQDSSASDIEFIRLMTGPQENLCIVFDNDQSIFGFRGADIDAVLKAINTQYNFTKYVLSQNYRSTKTIVAAAREVIQNNDCQIKKTVFTENEQGDPVILYEEINDVAEANRVVKVVKGLVRSEKMKYNDIAVLYRMQYLSRSIEEAFLRNSIPYEVVSGNPYYSRREIKDVLSYVKLIHNPYDRESFVRAIGIPKRGIGDKSIQKILSEQIPGGTLMDAAKKSKLKGKTKSGLENFVALLETLTKLYESNPDPATLVREIIRQTKYEEYLLDNDENAEERINNLIELINIAAEYDCLSEFISNLTLNYMTEEEKSGGVKLITMHSAKGLEYPAVILIGVNEGVTPHRLAETKSKLEEERRLFYVAMTRAEKYLFLLRSKMSCVQGKTIRTAPSRFLKEISDAYLYRFAEKQIKGGLRKIS